MLSQRSKYDKKDVIIFIIVTVIVYSMLILNIIYKNKGIIHVLYQYVASPIFWVGIIYVSLHSYFMNLTEKSKYSGRLSFIVFSAYAGIVIVVYSIIIMALIHYIPIMASFISHIIKTPLLTYALLAVSYAISFPLIFAVSAIAEAITYAVIGRVDAPFITRGSNYLAIWLLGYPAYGGMAFGGVYKGFTTIKTVSDGIDDVGRGILVHETQHVRGRHVPLILSSALALPIYILLTSSVRVVSNYAYFMYPFPFIALLPLILFRVCEVNADRAMFRAYGGKALDYMLAVLKSAYGVTSTERAPLASRITHTGRRDLVLAYGDAIAPHAPWEFPILLSMLIASTITMAFVSFATALINNVKLVMYVALLTYVGSIIGSLMLIMLLGLVLRPLARLFLGHALVSRGLLNISTLTAGLYLAVMGFAFYSINQYVLLASYFLIMLLIINYYVGINAKSIAYVASSLVVLFAASVAMHYVLIFSIHFIRILPGVGVNGAPGFGA